MESVLESKLPAWVSDSEPFTAWVKNVPRELVTALLALGELPSHSMRLWERMKLKVLQKVCIPQGPAGFSTFIAVAVLAVCEIFFLLSCCLTALILMEGIMGWENEAAGEKG